MRRQRLASCRLAAAAVEPLGSASSSASCASCHSSIPASVAFASRFAAEAYRQIADSSTASSATSFACSTASWPFADRSEARAVQACHPSGLQHPLGS